ncbi:hypothetical protein Ancab_014147 [Ancistrocladus abbreviatus]
MQQILEKVKPPSPSTPSQLPSPAKSISDLFDKISEELVKGLDSASELRRLVCAKSPKADLIQSLSTNIEISFSSCLDLLLNSANTTSVEDIKRFKSTTTPPDSKFEDSGETSKNSAAKDRRGCYKRRKTCQSWTVDCPTQSADSHAWRKYGQKGILNANYPRNYYRCTHKTDQGCPATKQVEQIAEDPPVFRTTYNGHHTCRGVHRTRIILDSVDKSEASTQLISFESNNPTTKHGLTNPFFSSFSNTIKHEDHQHGTPPAKEAHENMKAMTIQNQNQNHSSSSIDYLSSSDPTTIESSGPATGSDHGDVDVISGAYSCTTSSHHSLDIDPYGYMMMESVDDLAQIHEIFQFQ